MMEAFAVAFALKAIVLLIAIQLDRAFGEPDWLWSRVPHPVVIMGRVIAALENAMNPRVGEPDRKRPAIAARVSGVIAVIVICALAVLAGWAVLMLDAALLSTFALDTIHIMPLGPGDANARIPGPLEVLTVAVLLAGKSLREHVEAVHRAFAIGGLRAARTAVSMIVGRDPETLNEAGVARAAIETTAENYSDGFIAPAFWYLVAGPAGILVYKTINTADSMIGHRSPRYLHFGWAAARLDDLLNLVPARLSGLLIALAAPTANASRSRALSVMWRDAGLHKSPNAGWPEAAMASVLGLALAGPRTYAGAVTDDPWLNGKDGRRDARPEDIHRALGVTQAADRWVIGLTISVALAFASVAVAFAVAGT